VRKLAHSKIARFYEETGTSIARFGEILGKVLEAQFVIAFVNTALTALVIGPVLGWSYVPFLSVVVFVCGFVPVAGVFISSVPICAVGLYEGGLTAVAILVAGIVAIHMLEAYVLNPRIMGAALKVNPVLVLIVLVVGHHVLGVWGLLLGLPLCYWFFKHVIQDEDRPRIGFWDRTSRAEGNSGTTPDAARTSG